MIRSLLVLTLISLGSAAAAAPLTPEQKAQIDRIAEAALKETGVPAASIAVVTDGRVQYARAYGTGTGAKADALYPIASVSKQITAAAILLLTEEGKLSLGDPVSKYLPELTDADKVTIRQLLDHSSGYRDYWPQNYAFADMARPVAPQAILDRWAKAPLDFAPGSQWQYSNTGYVAAGLIVEKLSGEPLMRFFERRIFKPLGLRATDLDTGLTAKDAGGFTRHALGPVRPITPPAAGWLYAAGQLATTPAELSKWNIARMERRLLKPGSWAASETETKLTDGSGSGYGLGVFVGRALGHPRVEHGGAAVGYLAENRVYPADKAAVTVFVNADYGNAHSAIADRIEAMLLGDDADVAPARALFDSLQRGTPDRSRFTANFDAYLSPEVVADYKASLGPLGAPQSFVRVRPARMRGGFTSEVFRVTYPDRKLVISMRAEPNGGRVEEFLVYPQAD